MSNSESLQEMLSCDQLIGQSGGKQVVGGITTQGGWGRHASAVTRCLHCYVDISC